MENEKFKKKLLIWTVVYALLFLAIILIANLGKINAWLTDALRLLRPLLIGLILAYLCNPFFRLFERRVLYKLRPPSLRRALSLILTYLSVLLIIASVFLLIIPQLIESIKDFSSNYSALVSSAIAQFNASIDAINGFVTNLIGKTDILKPIEEATMWEKLNRLLGESGTALLESLKSINIKPLTEVIGNALSAVTDTIFGIFISGYLLSTKEKRYAQVMKVRRALFGDNVNAAITRFCTVADRSFGGFLEGKIIDSLIIGVLTYAIISIFKIPYAPLIATFVGLTNVVPIVGPFVGAIPTAVILLLTAPSKVIPFLIIILIIQQLDGNVIGPKILGSNTGISSLCVVIAIATMGALWGFAGMILGVPLFATVLELASEFFVTRLQKKGLPSGLENYYAPDITVDPTKGNDQSTDKFAQRLERNALRIDARLQEGEQISKKDRFLHWLHRILRRHNVISELSDESLVRFSADEAALAAQKAALLYAAVAETPAASATQESNATQVETAESVEAVSADDGTKGA